MVKKMVGGAMKVGVMTTMMFNRFMFIVET